MSLLELILIALFIWWLWHKLTSGSSEDTHSVNGGGYTGGGNVTSDSNDAEYYYKVTVKFADSLNHVQVYTNTYQSNIIFGTGKLKKKAESEVKAMYDVRRIIDSEVQDVTRQMKRAMR